MTAPRFCLWIALLAIVGCAPLSTVHQEGNACLRYFERWDQRIDAAEVRDHAAHRPVGFPWLRSTRFSAALRDELKSESQWSAWLALLRAEDLAARHAEVRNVGAEQPQREWKRLASCGEQLNAALLDNEAARARLLQRVSVPDDYSDLQRLLGLYPFAAPLLRYAIDGYQDEVQATYDQPLQDLDQSGVLQAWQPAAHVKAVVDVATLKRDAIGIPQLSPKQWQALAQQHAPSWWVDKAGTYDQPGRILLKARGVDLGFSQPVVYFDTSFTRHRGEVLPQLVYVMWFSGRPAQGLFDPYAGQLDGVVWRVTLNAEGQPLLYDSIHACGCYHLLFPAPGVTLKAQLPTEDEAFIAPQSSLPSGPLALRLASGTHYLQRVVAAEGAGRGVAREYNLREYRELLSLPVVSKVPQQRRSLFGQGGLVAGTERAERWWLWPSGVINPGAMRQHGRQATAFIGRRHFDDADWLDAVIE